MELNEIFSSTIKSQIDRTVTTFQLLLKNYSFTLPIHYQTEELVMQPNVYLRNHGGIGWATYSLWCLTFNNVHTKPFFLQLHVLAITIDCVILVMWSLYSLHL